VISLNPEPAVVGGPSFTLTVEGSDFGTDSVVLWGGTALPTTFISATQLKATVSGTLIASPQTIPISVISNGLTSNAVTFTAAEPWVQLISPDAVIFGQATPLIPDSTVSDWQTGLAFVDYKKLNQEGIIDGFLQVLEFDPDQPAADPVWVVENFPIVKSNVMT